jgi:hypothetical protein
MNGLSRRCFLGGAYATVADATIGVLTVVTQYLTRSTNAWALLTNDE